MQVTNEYHESHIWYTITDGDAEYEFYIAEDVDWIHVKKNGEVVRKPSDELIQGLYDAVNKYEEEE